ncbi:MAG: cobalt-precorrin-5B (C(1))-methyltransferase CbiD [Eubacteriales bacterium]
MLEQRNIRGKLLRCGYTTGSCAAAAAKAATQMLLGGAPVETVNISLPNGERLTLSVQQQEICADFSSCAVQKDSGDDPDVTDGMLIFARVTKTGHDVSVDGGAGIGRVTKAGLDQPIGAAAINTVPRQMIASSVSEVCREHHYTEGIRVVISAPEGERLAKRTFNARLGILGGISIIGTTGIVEPMSNKALIDTIRLELRQLATQGRNAVLLTPGNYGESFAAEALAFAARACRLLQLHWRHNRRGRNSALSESYRRLYRQASVKLGIGMTNTHSVNGDGRMKRSLPAR